MTHRVRGLQVTVPAALRALVVTRQLSRSGSPTADSPADQAGRPAERRRDVLALVQGVHRLVTHLATKRRLPRTSSIAAMTAFARRNSMMSWSPRGSSGSRS